MKRAHIEVIFSALFVAFLFWIVWQARDWDFRVKLFPLTIALPLLALAGVQLAIASWRAFMPSRPPERTPLEAMPEGAMRRGLGIGAWILGFAAAIWLAGFEIGASLAALAFLRTAAREPWKVAIVYAIATYACLWAGFDHALGITFPTGVVQDLLLSPASG